jgi:hypothetical protein
MPLLPTSTLGFIPSHHMMMQQQIDRKVDFTANMGIPTLHAPRHGWMPATMVDQSS